MIIIKKTTLKPISSITVLDIEAQIREIQSRKKEINEDGLTEKERVGLGESGYYDRDIYDGGGKYEGYVTSIAANDEIEVRVNFYSFSIYIIDISVLFKISQYHK